MDVPDCVIAGAGPTGLTLALELVRRGQSVRIFDRSPGPRPEDQSRALGILPPTLTILEACGVTETLLNESLHMVRVEIQYRGKPHAALKVDKGGGPYAFLLTLPQGRTERILEAALLEHGVAVEWNTQVVGLDQSGANPALIVDGGAVQERIEGRRVAGCDGVRSIIRESLGIAFDGEKIEPPFSLADVRLKNPPPHGNARINLLPNGVIVALPLPNGAFRLIGTSPLVHERAEIKNEISDLIWSSDFTISFRHVNQLQADNVFLAGDAAHVHSPVGGRGMNTGIADAAWLAWLISEGRENEYEAMRLPVAQHIIALTRRLTSIILANGPVANTIQRFALPFALRFDFVQRKVAGMALANDMPHPPWID